MAGRPFYVILLLVTVWDNSLVTSLAQLNSHNYQPSGYPQTPHPQYPSPHNNDEANAGQIATNFPEFPPYAGAPIDAIPVDHPLDTVYPPNPDVMNPPNPDVMNPPNPDVMNPPNPDVVNPPIPDVVNPPNNPPDPVNQAYPPRPFPVYPGIPLHPSPYGSTVNKDGSVYPPRPVNAGLVDPLKNTQPQANSPYNSYTKPTEPALYDTDNDTESTQNNALGTDESQVSIGDTLETDVNQVSTDGNELCREWTYLDDYCFDIMTSVRTHFHYNLNLNNIINDVFNPVVVNELKTCPNGSWCLPMSYHEDIKTGGQPFNDVYCKNVSAWSMRNCLQKLKLQRPECIDKDVDFVYKSIGLLCDMWDASFMELECYTRTKKSLYVMFRQIEQVDDYGLDLTTCSNYLEETLKTYLCADDACHYDQQESLQNFGPWKELAVDSEYFLYSCNINRSHCQGQDYPGDYYYDYGDYYADEDEDFDTYDEGTSVDDLIEKIMNNVHEHPTETTNNGYVMSHSSRVYARDRALFVGLIGSIIVFTIAFILLIVLGLRRYRTGQLGLPVYTKLATHEDICKAEFS